MLRFVLINIRKKILINRLKFKLGRLIIVNCLRFYLFRFEFRFLLRFLDDLYFFIGDFSLWGKCPDKYLLYFLYGRFVFES